MIQWKTRYEFSVLPSADVDAVKLRPQLRPQAVIGRFHLWTPHDNIWRMNIYKTIQLQKAKEVFHLIMS